MLNSHYLSRFAGGLAVAFAALVLVPASLGQDAPAKTKPAEKPANKATNDDKPKKANQDKTKNAKDDEKAKHERLVKTTSDMMMRKFESVKLSEDQKNKATKIIEQHVDALSKARNELSKLVTTEQKKQMAVAREKAKADGLKGKEMQATIEKAAGITEADKAARTTGEEKIKAISMKINEAITNLLTEEQKVALKASKAKPKKDNGQDKPQQKKPEQKKPEQKKPEQKKAEKKPVN